MLGKRPGPMIGKLSELLVSDGGRADTTGSPRGPSPLDMMKAQQQQQPSPRGLKAYDVGGVGLGIVVALDKPCQGGHEVLPKHAVCVPKFKRSGPIPVHSTRNPDGFENIDVGSLEDYTYVTCHVPNKSFTRVYCDVGQGDVPRQGYKYNNNNNNNVGVLRRATQAALVEPDPDGEPSYSFPTSNFLSSCHLCSKNLLGKDIYMYRGEKAFCSRECRSSQIMMDERKERCRSEASRSLELSSSPYTREQIFSTGILAL